MSFESLSLPVIFLLVGSSLVLLVSQDWRVMLTALGIQYAGVFVLVGIAWPLELAVIKLVTGIIAAAVLGMELVRKPVDRPLTLENQSIPFRISSSIFRIALAILIGLEILSLAPEMAKWFLYASYHQILGGLLLVGMGIMILGTTSQPFRVVVGLLTFLSGFEILFATLETSTLIIGFFSFISFGIALLGAYFITTQNDKVER